MEMALGFWLYSSVPKGCCLGHCFKVCIPSWVLVQSWLNQSLLHLSLTLGPMFLPSPGHMRRRTEQSMLVLGCMLSSLQRPPNVCLLTHRRVEQVRPCQTPGVPSLCPFAFVASLPGSASPATSPLLANNGRRYLCCDVLIFIIPQSVWTTRRQWAALHSRITCSCPHSVASLSLFLHYFSGCMLISHGQVKQTFWDIAFKSPSIF